MLYILCGLPASGKTTLAKQMENTKQCVRYSFDEYEGSNDPQKYNEAFKKYCQDINKEISLNKDIVCDFVATNKIRRNKFLKTLNNISCKKIIVVMTTPFEECLKRNEQRLGVKPDRIIMHILHKTYEIPTLDEGWDEILYF